MSGARAAVVTGGGSGIGRGIAERLARDGHAVAVLDVAAAAEVAAAITADGGRAVGYVVDVTDRASVVAIAGDIRAALGGPTILINCVGRSAWGDFLEISEEGWRSAIAVNLTSAFNCSQAFVPDMLEARWGRIVNITSAGIHEGAARLAPYIAAKVGVVGLTKSLSREFAPHGVTVNTVAPGVIDTAAIRRSHAQGFIDLERLIESAPVGRIGVPEDVANACSFLVEDAASYITGQIIPVNGGRTSTEP